MPMPILFLFPKWVQLFSLVLWSIFLSSFPLKATSEEQKEELSSTTLTQPVSNSMQLAKDEQSVQPDSIPKKAILEASGEKRENVLCEFNPNESVVPLKEDKTIALYKTSLQEFNVLKDDLKDTGRPEVYEDALELKVQNPFGVYVLKEIASGQVLGIQQLTPLDMSGVLMAKEVTDIFLRYQGKGYGRQLRTWTADIFKEYMGRVGLWQEKPDLPLSYVYSDNEWIWGENHSSLATSIHAGYGIVCIMPGSGLVHMLFPANKQEVWNERKESFLLAASKILVKGLQKIDKNEGEQAIDHLIAILVDLDFEKDPDLCSCLAIMTFLQSLDGLFNSDVKLTNHLNTLKKDHIHALLKLISNEEDAQEVSPSYLKNFMGFRNVTNYKIMFPTMGERLQRLHTIES